MVDFREELAPTPYLDGGLPLFTESPRRLILGNPAGIRRAGAVRSHSDLVSNVSMGGAGEYYALRCIGGSRRKRCQVTQQKASVQGPWLYDRRSRTVSWGKC